MASSEKTPGLSLNKWRGSDIPQREDFVSDNLILDTVITALQQQGGGSGSGEADPRLDQHLADSYRHLTDQDREALAGGVTPVIGTYFGDGQIYQGIAVGFKPRYGFVFAIDEPILALGSTGTFQIARFGIVSERGCTRGLETIPTGFRANQIENGTTAGVTYQGMNKSGMEYAYILWR